MNNDWQQFLDEKLTGKSSADTLKAENTVLSALPGEVVLRVTGEEAETFLQGQFSNDVAALSDPGSQLTTWSTPKGRVLALFRLYRVGDDFLIRLPAALADSFLKRLRMYVLRSKVVIEPLAEHVTFGIAGAQATALVEKTFGQAPADTDQCLLSDDVNVVAVRGEHPRFEITAPVTKAITLWNTFAEHADTGGESLWRLYNIEAGVPSVGEATSEAFVLQMLNLNHIDGVSFKKGCFPGQEVVARMQYLGKLKRRMYLLEGEEAAGVPLAGDELYSEGKSSAVGKVVDAQMAGEGKYKMLAVCAIEAMANPVYQEADARHAVAALELPYSVESAR